MGTVSHEQHETQMRAQILHNVYRDPSRPPSAGASRRPNRQVEEIALVGFQEPVVLVDALENRLGLKLAVLHCEPVETGPGLVDVQLDAVPHSHLVHCPRQGRDGEAGADEVVQGTAIFTEPDGRAPGGDPAVEHEPPVLGRVILGMGVYRAVGDHQRAVLTPGDHVRR